MNKQGNLRITLCTIINTQKESSVDYTISRYLLSNYSRIPQLNILDMANACYVDRSTIRRFFVKYGFGNFAKFKQSFADETELFTTTVYEDYNVFMNDLNNRLSSVLEQYVVKRDKTQEIDRFNQFIHDAETVYVFADESLIGQSHMFQQSMLSLGKTVVVRNPNECTVSFKDCVVVLSLTGRYLNTVRNCLPGLSCAKLLITIRDKGFTGFDYIASLSHKEEEGTEDIYRKYIVTYFFDVMLQTYKMKYKL